MAKRGKLALADNNKALASYLSSGKFENLTWYMKQRLLKTGYLTVEAVKVEGKKGRPKGELVLTGKGKGFLALAKRWKKVDAVDETKASA